MNGISNKARNPFLLWPHRSSCNDVAHCPMVSMTYRVHEAFLAIHDESPKHFAWVTITPGAIITLNGDVPKSGLVEVQHDGNIVEVFIRDILTRAELVEGKTVDS